MPQAPQGWTCLAPWTEGLGLGVHLLYITLRYPALEFSHAPPLSCRTSKIVSLAATLLRTALRKSLEMGDIYQDGKGRFGKRSVLLTPLQSPDSPLKAQTAFSPFCFYSENASFNGSILHQLMLL